MLIVIGVLIALGFVAAAICTGIVIGAHERIEREQLEHEQ